MKDEREGVDEEMGEIPDGPFMEQGCINVLSTSSELEPRYIHYFDQYIYLFSTSN
jgi:hypothetical protein